MNNPSGAAEIVLSMQIVGLMTALHKAGVVSAHDVVEQIQEAGVGYMTQLEAHPEVSAELVASLREMTDLANELGPFVPQAPRPR